MRQRQDAARRAHLNQEGIARRASEPATEHPPVAIRRVGPAAHRIAIAAAIGVDLLAVACGFFLASLFRFTPDKIISAAASPSGIAMVVLTTFVWVAMLSAREAYAPRTMVSGLDQLVRVASAFLPAWVLTQLLAFLLKETIPFESRLVMALSLPAVSLFLLAGRFWIVRPAARRVYRRLYQGPILVLGDSSRADQWADDLRERDPRLRKVVQHSLESLSPEAAARIVEDQGIGEVVIEPAGSGLEDVLDVAFACLDARAEVKIISSQFQVLVGRTAIGSTDRIPVLQFRRFDLAGPEAAVKRLVDIAGATIGLVLLGPVMLAIAIGVRLSSPGPILFSQTRIGRKGSRFTMYKFRTMVDGNDPRIHQNYLESYIRDGAAATVSEDGTKIFKLTADPRVTKLGSWLRALSLDELPQLWNVVRGDMSLVGPRPCLPYEWGIYKPWQRRRLDVLPGCTGLWQVTGRSLVSFEEMVILDLHYAHRGSVATDFGLIFHTLPAMLRGRGGF